MCSNTPHQIASPRIAQPSENQFTRHQSSGTRRHKFAVKFPSQVWKLSLRVHRSWAHLGLDDVHWRSRYSSTKGGNSTAWRRPTHCKSWRVTPGRVRPPDGHRAVTNENHPALVAWWCIKLSTFITFYLLLLEWKWVAHGQITPFSTSGGVHQLRHRWWHMVALQHREADVDRAATWRLDEGRRRGVRRIKMYLMDLILHLRAVSVEDCDQ